MQLLIKSKLIFVCSCNRECVCVWCSTLVHIYNLVFFVLHTLSLFSLSFSRSFCQSYVLCTTSIVPFGVSLSFSVYSSFFSFGFSCFSEPFLLLFVCIITFNTFTNTQTQHTYTRRHMPKYKPKSSTFSFCTYIKREGGSERATSIHVMRINTYILYSVSIFLCCLLLLLVWFGYYFKMTLTEPLIQTSFSIWFNLIFPSFCCSPFCSRWNLYDWLKPIKSHRISKILCTRRVVEPEIDIERERAREGGEILKFKKGTTTAHHCVNAIIIVVSIHCILPDFIVYCL